MQFFGVSSLWAGDFRTTVSRKFLTQEPPKASEAKVYSDRYSKAWKSLAATRSGSILMMQVFWITSPNSSGPHSRQGIQLSPWRPSHTGTAFFQDCRNMAWILCSDGAGAICSIGCCGDALLTFMIDGTVDRVRFMETFGHLIVTAIKATNGKHPSRCSLRRICASPVGTR